MGGKSVAEPKSSLVKKGGIGCLILVGGVILLAIAGGGDKTPPKKVEEAAAIPVTAEQLFNAYQDNEARAQQTYGGKPLRITGAVKSVDLGLGDEPSIALVSPNQFMPVTLQSSDSVKQAAPRFNKGDSIEAVCTDVSELAGRPFLKDCVVK